MSKASRVHRGGRTSRKVSFEKVHRGLFTFKQGCTGDEVGFIF